MLLTFAGSISYFAVLLGYVFILSSTASRIQHHVYRFAFLFVALVPVNFVVNYVTVWAFGYHKMGWTGALIIALLLATVFTFFPPQPHDPNTRVNR